MSFFDQEIYRVVPKKIIETEVVAPEFEIHVLGNNLSDVAVITNGSSGSNSAEQIEFLSKILHSINHSLEDVALYKVNEADNNLHDAIKSSPATKILSFGLNLNLEDPSKVILASEKLSLIMKDNSLKRKLWEELKRMF